MKISNRIMANPGGETTEGSRLRAASPAMEIEIREQLRRKDYGGVLDTLAKMAGEKMVSPEAFYAGAYAYFMRGDYERAATWVGNVLTYAPRHVAARILLARLCILEDRAAEALAVLELLLKGETGGLTEEERDEIREIAGYYGRSRRETVCRDYPHLAAFLQLQEAAPIPETVPRQLSRPNSSGDKAVAAPIPATAQQPVRETEDGIPALARQKLEEIRSMECPLRAKVELLASFAGAWYFDGHPAAAELLLKEAASLDGGDGAVLRGLALLAAESGDMDRALQLAAGIKPTDFLLLRTLREVSGA